MPKIDATIDCPSPIAQRQLTHCPIAVAAATIGTNVPSDAEETYPVSTNPSAIEPTTNDGNPRISGSPPAPTTISIGAPAGCAGGSGPVCSTATSPSLRVRASDIGSPLLADPAPRCNDYNVAVS